MKQGNVPIKTADGQVGSVPVQELDKALAAGAQVIEQSEHDSVDRMVRYGTAGQAALAAAEGVGRAATFGSYDWIARQAGADMDAIRARKEENQLVAGVGEVAGIAGMAALTGGLSLFGEAAQGARLGSLALRGAAEGALFGAGQAMSEEALHNRDLTAEKLLIGIGQGALLGGIVGGAFGAVGRRGNRAVGEIAEIEGRAADDVVAATVGTATEESGNLAGQARRFAREWSDTTAKSSLKGRQRGQDIFDSLQAANPEASAMVPKMIREELGQKAGIAYESMSPNQIAKAAAGVRDDAGKALEKGLQGLDSVAAKEERPVFGMLRKVDDEARTAIKQEIDGLKSELAKAGNQDLKRVISTALKERQATFARMPKTYMLEGTTDVSKKLAGVINGLRDDLGAGGTELFLKIAKKLELEERAISGTEGFAALHKLRVAFDKNAKYTVSPLGKPTAESKLWRELRGIIEDELETQAETVSAKYGLADSYRLLKQRYAAANAVADVAKLGARGEGAIRKWSLGDMMGAATGAAALGPVGSIAGGLVSNYVRRHGDAVASVLLDRFAQKRSMQVMSTLWNGVDEEIKVVGSSIFGGGGRKAVATKVDAEATEKAVRQALADPEKYEAAMDIAMRPIESANKEVADAMRLKLMRATNYLASKLPRVEINPMMPQAQPPRRTTAGDKERWRQYAEGVADPFSALRDLQAGKLSREKAEAVREVYPAVFEVIKNSIIMQAQQQKTPVSYEKQLQISIMTGVPLHPTMDKQFIRMTQMMMGQQTRKSGIKRNNSAPKMAGAWFTEVQKI